MADARCEGIQILRPFDRREALTLAEAAEIAGRSAETVRLWAMKYDIGRPVVGRWMVSRIALAMLLDGDHKALHAFVAGNRRGSAVINYLERVP